MVAKTERGFLVPLDIKCGGDTLSPLRSPRDNGDNDNRFNDGDDGNDADIESDKGDDGYDSESMTESDECGILCLRDAHSDERILSDDPRAYGSNVLRLRGGNDKDSDDNYELVVRRLEQRVSDLQQSIDLLSNRITTPTRRKQLVRATYPFKVPQRRLVRSDERNAVMRITRKEMSSILGIGKDREFPSVINARPELLANFDEVERFCSDNTAPGPSLEAPQIYLDIPECIWNSKLAWLFGQSVVEKYHNRNFSEDVFARHFLDRIETLRKVYNKSLPRENENVEDAQRRLEQDFAEDCRQKRRRRRQNQLYEARLAVCEANIAEEGWELLFQMVSRLEIDGQSSDESDDGGQFKVKIQTWRNPQVSSLLYHIDEHRPTTNHLGNRRPSAPPRYRHYSEDITSRQLEDIPSRLPSNMYSTTWYESLVELYRLRLDPQSTIVLPEIDYVAA
ncbi:hypothetical protein E4T56_gene20976 [Termitomyces sp. T112]|nr:hypothetical protein E4T56_gene20976 [Termitomyces sp. T112]